MNDEKIDDTIKSSQSNFMASITVEMPNETDTIWEVLQNINAYASSFWDLTEPFLSHEHWEIRPILRPMFTVVR